MTTQPIAFPPAPFKYATKAHPTVYSGITFRSRLEATWAAFFDLVKLRWSYEPLDLNGWVPDFILEETVAVEVKPIRRLSDMPFEVAKMRASGWPGMLVVLGTQPRCYRTYDSAIGWCLTEGSFSGARLSPPHSSWFTGLSEGDDLHWSYETDGGMGAVQDLLDDARAAAFKTTQWKAPTVRRRG